jgi:uncharacterized protein
LGGIVLRDQRDAGLQIEAYDKPGMLTAIREQFRIDWHGIHGANHWARVLHHGMAIGTERSADLLVVELFAFLHDSQRENEWIDPNHGSREAEYASSLNRIFFDLNGDQLDMLCLAMRGHSDGGIHPDATIQTCWDADRLDLGRVGKKPKAQFLSKEGAKHIDSAYRWSLQSDSHLDEDFGI